MVRPLFSSSHLNWRWCLSRKKKGVVAGKKLAFSPGCGLAVISRAVGVPIYDQVVVMLVFRNGDCYSPKAAADAIEAAADGWTGLGDSLSRLTDTVRRSEGWSSLGAGQADTEGQLHVICIRAQEVPGHAAPVVTSPVIAHEALHAASYISRSLGVREARDSDNEFLAYMTDWLVDSLGVFLRDIGVFVSSTADPGPPVKGPVKGPGKKKAPRDG